MILQLFATGSVVLLGIFILFELFRMTVECHGWIIGFVVLCGFASIIFLKFAQ